MEIQDVPDSEVVCKYNCRDFDFFLFSFFRLFNRGRYNQIELQRVEKTWGSGREHCFSEYSYNLFVD